MSEQTNQETYLGDGAYAAFDGYAVTVYTGDGYRVTNRVVLEPQVIQALVEYLVALGFKMPSKPENQ